jgi:predicted alpha/beta superfamily hydrolase
MCKYFLLLISIAILSCSRHEDGREQTKHDLNFGVIDSIHSDILDENRKIWVYSPPDTTQQYPLLVLLDGDAHYFSVAGMIHQLSTINGNTIYPEMVVVAIPNTDRTRDLTPYHVTHIFGDTAFAKTSGGGENFTKFIEKELLPFVDKKYPTSSHRTLVGHSFGGLFVVNTLVHHPGLFTNYLAIDPSLWWDDQKFGADAAKVLTESKFENKSLFVAIANTIGKGKQLGDVKNDTASSTVHVRSIIKFNDALSTVNNGLTFSAKYYPDDDHSSVPLAAAYDGLRSFFSWYKLEGIDQFFDRSYPATPQDVIKVVSDHYQNVSKHFGCEVLPSESKINGMGYGFMNNGMPDKAFACFELNIRNYPQSSNVFDSMGDYYTAQKDTVNAILNYEKALSIQKVELTEEKLAKLKR